MKLGTEDKKKFAIACVAGVIALGAVGYTGSFFFGGSAPAPVQSAPTIIDNTKAAGLGGSSAPGKTTAVPPGNVVAGAAEKVGSTSGALDPTLHAEAMLNTESLVYGGTGRNIFAGTVDAPAAELAEVFYGAIPRRMEGTAEDVETSLRSEVQNAPV